jgi:hypothetical protein
MRRDLADQIGSEISDSTIFADRSSSVFSRQIFKLVAHPSP